MADPLAGPKRPAPTGSNPAPAPQPTPPAVNKSAPAPMQSPAGPTSPGTAGSLFSGVGDAVHNLVRSGANAAVNQFGSPQARAANQIFDKYNVPLDKRLDFNNRFQGVQNAANSGNYGGAYQGTMGLLGDLRNVHPDLPGAMGEYVQNQHGDALGGFAGPAYQAMNAWQGMVGTPEAFGRTAMQFAPGLLQGLGAAGMPAALGAYGAVSGDKSVLDNLKYLLPKGQGA